MPENDGFVNIYILSGFANYFDRKIFYYNSLLDYIGSALGYEIKEGINFNPADGVDTSLNIEIENDIPNFNYLLVVDPADNRIISRWYIMDLNRNLSGQYRATLKRDVIAEAYSKEEFLTEAPIFVEKGILKENDPLIVNDEGMNFNLIKKAEFPLNQRILNAKIDSGWIVGYMQNAASTSGNATTKAKGTLTADITISDLADDLGIDVNILENAITAEQGIAVATGDISLVYGVQLGFSYRKVELLINSYLSGSIKRFNNLAFAWSDPVGSVVLPNFEEKAVNPAANYIEQNYSDFETGLNNVLANDNPNDKYYSENLLVGLRNYADSGTLISYNGKIYKISSVYVDSLDNHNEVVITKEEDNFFDNMINELDLISFFDNWNLYLNYEIKNIKIRLTEVRSAGLYTKITISHKILRDAPYSIFAIPYNSIPIKDGNETFYSLSREDALDVANSIALKLADNLIDLQLVPYMDYKWFKATFPIPPRPSTAYLNLADKIENEDFEYIRDGNDNSKVGAVIFLEYSNFDCSMTASSEGDMFDLTERKIKSQTDKFRICSPNYAGIFEYNLAKITNLEDLYGSNVFRAKNTLKPYQPFIYVYPQDMDFLYGADYQDNRGLICGGDFSLPIIKDVWETYQQNNKNFASIFSRDIQNLDVSQKIERINENIALGAGVFTGGTGGATAGALAGGKVGGGYGAIAGAVLGGISGTALGTIGGLIESKLGQERRAEAKDYAIDRFNMNLGNIKAIPDSLSKVSALTCTNKIVPFLEYYTCTNEEKEALKRKIKYDGMTVGRIDNLINYLNSDEKQYFKGQLIRAVGIDEDNHFINALYEEIAKGVYI